MAGDSVCFRTDDAWDFIPEEHRLPMPVVDVSDEAKGLRFITSASKINAFAARHRNEFRPFTLFGSGDFHHLSAVWQRQFNEPFSVLSFDNHPDWTFALRSGRPARDQSRARKSLREKTSPFLVADNFECGFPTVCSVIAGRRKRISFSSILAAASRALSPLPQPASHRKLESHVHGLARSHHDHKVYVTIDIDCSLRGGDYELGENGRFTCDDIIWACARFAKKLPSSVGIYAAAGRGPPTKRASKNSPVGLTILPGTNRRARTSSPAISSRSNASGRN